MNRRAWILFVAVCLLWGIPYFLIKLALHDLTPLSVAFVRIAIGAAVLLPVALQQKMLTQLRGRWAALVALALVEIAAPFVLIASGEQWVSSALTAVLIATEPMFVALLALRFDHSERVGPWQLGGMTIGLAGVAVLLGVGGLGRHALAGAAMILLATLAYAAGALLIKRRFNDLPATGVVASSLAVSGVLLAAPGILSLPHSLPSGTTISALLVLGVACTGLGFIAFFSLIGEVGAGRATVITYVTPAIAVLLGVIANGEVFTATSALGLILILTGSWLATQERFIRRLATGERAA